MGSQTGSTPSSSSGVGMSGPTPAQPSGFFGGTTFAQPSQPAQPPAFLGGGTPNPTSGFGGMNGQSMANQDSAQQPMFDPGYGRSFGRPYGPPEDTFSGGPMQSMRFFGMPRPTPNYGDSGNGVPAGVNPVLQQQLQAMQERAAQTAQQTAQQQAADEAQRNATFYSWGSRGVPR